MAFYQFPLIFLALLDFAIIDQYCIVLLFFTSIYARPPWCTTTRRWKQGGHLVHIPSSHHLNDSGDVDVVMGEMGFAFIKGHLVQNHNFVVEVKVLAATITAR